MSANINWNVIAGISSSIIALCALCLTIWQAYVARMHNKLSVTPYLTTWTHIELDKLHYSVEILNNGIGSALIKNFQIFVDGHEVQGQDLEIMQKALKIIFPNYNHHVNGSYLSEGYMMSPKESRSLVSL